MNMSVEERKKIVLDFLKSKPNTKFTNQRLQYSVGRKINHPEYMTRYTRKLFQDGKIKCLKGNPHQFWYSNKKPTILQHPVEEEHLKHIGDIIVSFAMLESTIQSLLGSLVYEHQRIGQIITAELSFAKIRALLISLYLERHGEDNDFKTFKTLMNRAKTIEDKRNQLVHSVWVSGKDINTITRVKTTAKETHGIRFHWEDITANHLKRIASDIKVLAFDIRKFHTSLMYNRKVISNPLQKFWP